MAIKDDRVTQSKADIQRRPTLRSNLVACFTQTRASDDVESPALVEPQIQRLGKRELGKYAFETRMPRWLHTKLEAEDQKSAESAPCLIPPLASLLSNDKSVQEAYLCHSSVRYIGKIHGEGHDFCGYRNIQMLFSYLLRNGGKVGVGVGKGVERIPSVFELQDMIEEAWAKGENSYGKVQTGGIKGTRKHIGTPEAQALLRNLNLFPKASRFQALKDGKPPYVQLLDFAHEYFTQPLSIPTETFLPSPAIHPTIHPPIYLQRPHHSMTIIGLEIRRDGSRNLLVFDPAYRPSKGITHEISVERSKKRASSLLKPYRRGRRQLKRYHAFETLSLGAFEEPS